jgi:hypothetical protein
MPTTYSVLGQRSTNAGPRASPEFPPELANKVKMNCTKSDPACDKTAGTDIAAHLTYNKAGTPFQVDSAKFIVAGFTGQPLPKVNNNPVPT